MKPEEMLNECVQLHDLIDEDFDDLHSQVEDQINEARRVALERISRLQKILDTEEPKPTYEFRFAVSFYDRANPKGGYTESYHTLRQAAESMAESEESNELFFSIFQRDASGLASIVADFRDYQTARRVFKALTGEDV